MRIFVTKFLLLLPLLVRGDPNCFSNCDCSASGGCPKCTFDCRSNEGARVDMDSCTTNCQCAGGYCSMKACVNNCQCVAGSCDQSTCFNNCVCSGGNCDQSECIETTSPTNCQCGVGKCDSTTLAPTESPMKTPSSAPQAASSRIVAMSMVVGVAITAGYV